MAMTTAKPQAHTFTRTSERNVLGATLNSVEVKSITTTYTATFNGKIYNGKRYINVSYRLGGSAKQYTCIWKDGFGWVECDYAGDTLEELFGLE